MSITTLATLATRLPVPKDYFSGLRAPGVVRADNLLMFFREGYADLQQRSLENQSHHRFVLLMPLEGGASVNLDGVEFPLDPGMALLVHPFQFHFFLHPTHERLAWLILTFDSDTPGALAPLRDKPVRLAPDALRRLESLLRAYLDDRAGAEGEVRLTAEILLQKLVRAPGSPVARRGFPAKSGARGAADWLAHINRRLHDGGPAAHRIVTLASEIGVSERLLRLRFSESFGVSLGAYIDNFRLTHAAGLITRSVLPFSEISRRCGYASQAAFSRAFKARTGLTPKDYRVKRRA
jgi:AraC-like DNA-binding protein